MRILLLNGPNLNLLGTRRPDVYGPTTLAELETAFAGWGDELGVSTIAYQSNHEGALIDRIHAARDDVDGIVFNPGAFTHTSYALHDAIEAVELPTVEIHISNVEEREEWRRRSVIAPAAVHRIYGRGIDGYRWALRHLVARAAVPADRVAYGPDPQQFFEYRSGGPRLAVLIHGGFWRHTWSFDTLDLVAVDLARRGWSVASAEYRRVGNGGGWPVSKDDVVAGARAAAERSAAESTVLIGHSAGGQLALEAASELGSGTTAVSMGGVNDMVLAVDEFLGDGAALDYLGGANPEAACPTRHPPPGPVVIAHGTDDDRVPFAHAERYLEADPDARLLATVGGDHFRFFEPADPMWTGIVETLEAMQ
jgi:3-dehydroquinate dehydratase type II